MKKLKKIMAGVFALACVLSAIGPLPVKAAATLSIDTPDNKVLTYTPGTPQDFALNVTNTGDKKLNNVVISPKLKSSLDEWPFQTDYQSYTANIPELAPNETKSVSYSFAARDDVPTGRFVLNFDVNAVDEDGLGYVSESSFYVNTKAKAQTNPDGDKNNQNPGAGDGNNQNPGGSGAGGADASGAGEDQGGSDLMSASAGGYSNGDASYVGGASSGNGSVPRVIVTGFETNPAQVKAGSNFTLVIHLKNTSKSTKVSNMLFDLQAPTEGSDQNAAPAFLPASGSNSIYLEGMKADGTADISIQLNAKADLVQKPYGINVNMKYEDSSAAQVEGSSSISIPVKQEARFEFSEFDITSDSIAVGEENNISCSLYNMGRIKLYNVKAVFEGNGIKKEELFVGNVEPGATASIDAMLEGQKATKGPEKVKMTVSYEDDAGNVSKVEKDLQMEVTEAVDDAAMSDMAVEPQSTFPIIPVIIGALLVLAIIIIVIVRKKKKKLMDSEEEEGLLDELDGPSEDE